MEEKVMELFQRVRDTASIAADAAADTARVAGRKAGQMVDVAKLNVQLFECNSDFNESLRQLGQVVYDAHLGKQTDDNAVETLLKKADEQRAKAQDVKQRIADLRQSKACPGCGAVCGKDDAFCHSCGSAL